MLRPDKVIFSIKEYVTKHMGEEFINIPLFDMATSFAESSKTTPLILILSPGTLAHGGIFALFPFAKIIFAKKICHNAKLKKPFFRRPKIAKNGQESRN